MSEGNYIQDESNPLKNSTLIPNIIDDMDLSVHAFRLYIRFKRRVNQQKDGSTKGECYESTRSLAKSCKMNKDTVTTAKKELVAAGLIRIETKPGRHGEFAADHIAIVDIWEANRNFYSETFGFTLTSGKEFVGKDARKVMRKREDLQQNLPNYIRQFTCSPGEQDLSP